MAARRGRLLTGGDAPGMARALEEARRRFAAAEVVRRLMGDAGQERDGRQDDMAGELDAQRQEMEAPRDPRSEAEKYAEFIDVGTGKLDAGDARNRLEARRLNPDFAYPQGRGPDPGFRVEPKDVGLSGDYGDRLQQVPVDRLPGPLVGSNPPRTAVDPSDESRQGFIDRERNLRPPGQDQGAALQVARMQLAQKLAGRQGPQRRVSGPGQGRMLQLGGQGRALGEQRRSAPRAPDVRRDRVRKPRRSGNRYGAMGM